MTLECRIDVLNLSARCSNALKAENIILVRDLIKLTPAEIKNIVNIGEKQVSEIQNEVSRFGLALGCSVQPVKQEEDSPLNIEKEHCDYYLEVYWWDYTLVDKVATKKEKNVLAFIGLYRDYELEFEDQLTILTNLRENLISAYLNWPDGEVTVSLVIKEEGVNL